MYEIYAYYKNLYEGKKGFGQGQYAHRALVYGTRNVITSSQLLGKNPDDPAYHKYDETIVPVFQAAKAFQPLVIHELKRIFYNQIFTLGSTRVPAIDPKTLKVLYIEVTSAQVTEAMSTKTSEDLISLFKMYICEINLLLLRMLKTNLIIFLLCMILEMKYIPLPI